MGNTTSCCVPSSPKLRRNAHSRLESYRPDTDLSREDTGCNLQHISDRENIDGEPPPGTRGQAARASPPVPNPCPSRSWPPHWASEVPVASGRLLDGRPSERPGNCRPRLPNPAGPVGAGGGGCVCEPVARGLEPATAGAPREPGFLALLDAARGQVSATRGIMFVVLKGNGMGEP
jgi:hypothetical protein